MRELQDTRCSPTEVVRMYEAGKEQSPSEHFSTVSTDLSSNCTGMWMSVHQLVKPYHQIKALCTHTLLHLSKNVWHWAPLDIEAQPTCSISSYIPTCRWTLHHRSAEIYGTLPPLTPPLFSGFFQKKGKAGFSMFHVQGKVITLHRSKKENVLVCECRETHPVSLQCHKFC